ncbi:MAG: DsbE family thiol:disulfide interchange protein [Acidiferrobacterales bacterium]
MKKYLVPIIAFALLGVLLWKGLSLDPRRIPSPLIGKALPDFSLARVTQPNKVISPKDLHGRVYLLNIWASWCVACRQEHPLLMEMQRKKLVPIIGLNYKDNQDDARAFLSKLSNPYEMSLADLNGHVGIDLGVYGVPETFVIDKQGIIRYKHVGPIDEKSLAEEIMPVVHQIL